MPSFKFKNPETGKYEKLRGGVPGMNPSVYDPQGKKTDIFAYTDEKIAAIPTPDVSGQIGAHNTDTAAHRDIRNAIPNVPSWAMQANKPTYSASEVGADASGAAASALSDAKAYTDNKIAAISTPDVSGQIEEHNEDTAAHQDIRNAIAAIPTPDVSDQIGAHNTDTAAHQDIRNAIPNVPSWAMQASKPTYTASEVGADASGAAASALSDAKAYTDEKIAAIPNAGSGVTVHTATIGTTWTEDTGVKSQNVAIEGVTASNTATVDHVFTAGTEYADFVEAENQYLEFITNGYAETYDGGITFHIFGDAPTVTIPIVVEVV